MKRHDPAAPAEAAGVEATAKQEPGRPGERSGAMPAVGVDLLPHAARLPPLRRMTPGASGYDLRAAIAAPVTLRAGAFTRVPTGVRLAVPQGFEAQVRARSGLAARHGIGVLNGPGTIDSDYRGEIQVILFNFGAGDYTIEPGDRIAQLVFARVHHPILEARNLDDTTRGGGGFGHTGSA